MFEEATVAVLSKKEGKTVKKYAIVWEDGLYKIDLSKVDFAKVDYSYEVEKQYVSFIDNAIYMIVKEEAIFEAQKVVKGKRVVIFKGKENVGEEGTIFFVERQVYGSQVVHKIGISRTLKIDNNGRYIDSIFTYDRNVSVVGVENYMPTQNEMMQAAADYNRDWSFLISRLSIQDYVMKEDRQGGGGVKVPLALPRSYSLEMDADMLYLFHRDQMIAAFTHNATIENIVECCNAHKDGGGKGGPD
jgi:hypothetical protein